MLVYFLFVFRGSAEWAEPNQIPPQLPLQLAVLDPCAVPLGTSQGLDLSSPAENEVFYGGPDSQKTSIRENLVFLRIKWASRAKKCDFT